MEMEGSFFTKLKNRFNNKKDNYPQFSEYSFSGEELDSLSRQNIDEINKLRTGFKVNKDKKIEEDNSNLDAIVLLDKDIVVKEDNADNNIEKEDNKEEYNGYVNLSSDTRENIMKRWNSIDIVRLTHDIYEGKDILDHNYTITYADNALEYIYRIRGEYDILIEYLIGFNNEKKGVLNKNIFSDRLDNEWKYLKNYIKVLEKIKNAIER